MLTIYQSHLFLNHVLLFHLENRQLKEAILFSSHYQHLVFFAHALEMMLHTVVEADASANHDRRSGEETARNPELLPDTVDFLDHFDVALDVVVGCARKIEMTRWPRLFDIVGNPKQLFEVRLECSYHLPVRLIIMPAMSLVQPAKDGRVVSTRLAQSRSTRRGWIEWRCSALTEECYYGSGLAAVPRDPAVLALC